MKRFWLLDINYEVSPERDTMFLWCIDEEGKRVLLLDEYHPYFYAVFDSKANAESAARSLSKSKHVLKAEVVKRKYFGEEKHAVKVTCHSSSALKSAVKAAKKLAGKPLILEDDIRSSAKYLLDLDLSPSAWFTAEVEETEVPENCQVDAAYKVKGKPATVEIHEVPDLRVMAFSMVCYSEKGAPIAEHNPVIIISIATNDGKKHQIVAKSEKDDREVLEEFVEFVQDYDPDVIAGYGSNWELWPYLMKRSKKSGVPLAVGRNKGEPHTSLYGHVSVTGRANVDFFDFAEKDLPVKLKLLDEVAEFLGVMPKDRVKVGVVDVAKFWKERREDLLKSSMQDAEMVLGICEKMLDFAIQLSSLVGIPLDHVGTAAIGFRVEHFLMRKAIRFGELIPKREKVQYIPYKGAIVLKPKPGLHEKVAVLDFKSMYPSIMIAKNISPDTYEKSPKPGEEVVIAPEVGHAFRQKPDGFYRKVLSELLRVRDELRQKLKKLKKTDPAYRILDARQKAVKVITNACYGYAGWIGARWYVKPVAEATTAFGRQTITTAIKMAEELGLSIIYGDTDSVFVKYDPQKTEKLLSMIQEKLGLIIKPDKVYERILFTEAKKRYAGLLEDGTIDVVGLEVARGDWSEVAKEAQMRVLRAVLKEGSVEKAIEEIRELIKDLREKKVPYEDLIIWKTLTKKPEEYEVRTAHVEAMRKMLAAGFKLDLGDKVGYVITKGAGKLYERAMPYFMTNYDEVDIDYYIQKQIIPAAMRILRMFGVKQDELLKAPAGRPRTLFEFM